MRTLTKSLLLPVLILGVSAGSQEPRRKSRTTPETTATAAEAKASGLSPDSPQGTEPRHFPAAAPDSSHPVERASARGVMLEEETVAAPGEARVTRTRLMQTTVQPGPVRVVEEWTGNPANGDWHCTGRWMYLADQVLLRVHPGTAAGRLRAALDRAGAEAPELVAPDLYTVKLRRADLAAVPAALAALAAEKAVVAAVEPDGVGFGGGLPNDAQFSTQWGHHNTGQSSGAVDADVDAPEFWDVIESAPGVVIAVLDSGLNFTHPDLQNIAWRNPGEIPGDGLDNDGSGRVDDLTGWDFVNNDSNPADDHGHGSNVTGIMAANRHNSTGIAGMISGAPVMVCKILNSSNSGTTSSLIAATTYARQRGAAVMNLSLQNYPYSATLDAEFTACRNAGILLSICAGNQGANNDTAPNYPSSYPHDNIVSVANHDRRDTRWSGTFNPSNYGAVSVDIFAPGRSILSPVLGTSYSEYTGTSQAAPYVTAVAAALKYLRPSWQAPQLKASLLGSAVTRPAYSGQCVTGGRFNALAAAAHAIRQAPDNDADGDSFPDLYEYLAGSRTDSAASFPQLAASLSGGYLRLSLPRVVRPEAAFAIERSDDLVTWHPDGITVFSSGAVLEAGVALDAGPRNCLRFRPVLPP